MKKRDEEKAIEAAAPPLSRVLVFIVFVLWPCFSVCFVDIQISW